VTLKALKKLKFKKRKKSEPTPKNPQPAPAATSPPPPTSTPSYLQTKSSDEGGAVNMAFEPDPVNISSQITTPRSNYDPRLPPPIPPRINNYDPNYDNATTTSY